MNHFVTQLACILHIFFSFSQKLGADSWQLPQCHTWHSTEYKDVAHYREINTTDLSICCHECGQDPDCGGWKICSYHSGKMCRLLPNGKKWKEVPNPGCVSGVPAHSPTLACDVRAFGAKGDGVVDDTRSINDAIASCDHVIVAEGVYKSSTIVLKSNLIFEIQESAAIRAAESGFLSPLQNNFSAYQDYGHSHWRDSLFYGRALSNVTISGGGLVDGYGNLASGEPNPGRGCRMFGLVSCADVTIANISTRSGGWFTVLATNITGLRIERVNVQAQRDGFDIVSSRHVQIIRCNITGGGDDAIAVKSDFSLGKELESFDIVVANSVIGSTSCNGLQIGSETVGPIYNARFENISIATAGKAGIGIVSMDGSHIYNVSYNNISMSAITTPIYMYIGSRMRRPNATDSSSGASVGSISNVSITNVHVSNVHGKRGNFSSTLDGQPVDLKYHSKRVFPVGPGIVLSSISIVYKGGGNRDDVNLRPPHPSADYPPRYLGVRPSYAFFIRRATGILLRDVNVSLEKRDSRPAFMLSSSQDIVFKGVDCSRGAGQPWDVGLIGNCTNVDASMSNLTLHTI